MVYIHREWMLWGCQNPPSGLAFYSPTARSTPCTEPAVLFHPLWESPNHLHWRCLTAQGHDPFQSSPQSMTEWYWGVMGYPLLSNLRKVWKAIWTSELRIEWTNVSGAHILAQILLVDSPTFFPSLPKCPQEHCLVIFSPTDLCLSVYFPRYLT